MENKEENTSWMTNTPLARKLALSVNLPGKGKSKATAPRENTSRPASPNMESGTPSVDPSTVGATPKGGRRRRKTHKNRKSRKTRKSHKY